MFVDQRWIDLAPSLFDVHIVRDAGWNVAYWNLAQRPITRFGNRLEAAGRPLRFFHYSGFDPDRPRLSLFQGENPRVRLEEQPVVAELCERYARRLIDAGYRAHSRLVYGFAHTSTGLALDQTARRLYRRELIKAERTGAPEPPNPFEPEARDDFESWLRDPAGAHGVTRYLRAVHTDHAQLQVEFRDLDGAGGRGLLWWALTHGVKNGDVMPRLVEPETIDGVRTAPGVNVAGYMRAESGVGEAGRLLVAALDAADVPRSIVTYDNTRARQQAQVPDDGDGRAEHDIDIVCVNADQLHHFLEDTGRGSRAGYRVGVWAWEVDVLPDRMARADRSSTRSGRTARTRRTRSAPRRAHRSTSCRRRSLRPDSRRCRGPSSACPTASCSSSRSTSTACSSARTRSPRSTRSRRAFAGRDGVRLVIKTVSGDQHAGRSSKRLRAAAGARANMHVRDGYVDTRGAPGARRRVRRVRLTAPRGGLRTAPGRGDGARQAGDRDRVLGQPRVHGRDQQPAGAVHARADPATAATRIPPARGGRNRTSMPRRPRCARSSTIRRSLERSRSAPRPTSPGCTHRRCVDASSPISSAVCRRACSSSRGSRTSRRTSRLARTS